MSSIIEIKNKLNQSPRSSKSLYNKNKELIDSLFPDVNNYPEKMWLIVNDEEKVPECICGRSKLFYRLSDGYFESCGDKKCKDEIRIKKTERTNLKKYGTKSCLSNEDVKNKIKQTNIEKYGGNSSLSSPEVRLKGNLKMIDLYGVDSPLQSSELKSKRDQTMLDRYSTNSWFSTEDYRQKMKDKYGHVNPMKVPDIVDKAKKTQIDNKLNIILERLKTYEFVNYESFDTESQRFILVCNSCENKFSIIRNGLCAYMKSNVNSCPTCNYKNRFRSKPERELFDWLNSLDTNLTITSNIKFNKTEVDIFIEELNLAIEFNGLYWHSERHKENDYHLKKSEMLESLGISLIHVWEDDWNLKKDILKSILQSKISPVRIGARKTKIEIVNYKEAKKFHDNYHLDGNGIGSYHIGLYVNNDLISCATFGKSRYDKNYQWELVRYTTKNNYSVIGGFSKLLKKFKDDNSPKSLMTYKKLDLGTSNIYQKIGFFKIKRTNPNYFWIVDDIRKNRQNYQKHKLKITTDETAVDYMHRLGYFRIFDSGNDSFGIIF